MERKYVPLNRINASTANRDGIQCFWFAHVLVLFVPLIKIYIGKKLWKTHDTAL